MRLEHQAVSVEEERPYKDHTLEELLDLRREANAQVKSIEAEDRKFVRRITRNGRGIFEWDTYDYSERIEFRRKRDAEWTTINAIEAELTYRRKARREGGHLEQK